MRRFRRQELRVESFELVEVGPGLALLRLAGEWRSGVPTGVRLVASHDGVAEELMALPEPPGDGGGLWRLAFSADTELLGARFRLHTDDGRSITLPQPVALGAPEPEVAAPPADLDDSEYIHVEGEDPVQAERIRAERTEASLREQLRIMVNETAEFMGRLEGYELRRAELEKELSWERLLHKETRRTLEEAEQERDDAVARMDETVGTRRQLATARERIFQLEQRLEQQEELLRGVRAAVDGRAKQLARLEERLVRVRAAFAAGVTASPEALERARTLADEGAERLAELEERVTELRAEI